MDMDNNGIGDGDRASSMLIRCPSQSSLDESSQTRVGGGGAGAGGAGGAAAGTEHAAALLDALAALRRERSLCDVTLHAAPDMPPGDVPQADRHNDMPQDEQYPVSVPESADAGGEGARGAHAGVAGEGVWAHRAVLAASSPYFRAMFAATFSERAVPSVTIRNVEPGALAAIVDYIYNPDSLVITEDNVQALLSASSLLAVGGVRALCCRYLSAALTPECALGVRQFAELHACTALAAAAHRYCLAHFPQVVQGEEFLALDAAGVCSLLADDALWCGPRGELAVLEAAARWAGAGAGGAGERAGRLARVLPHVRLPLLPREELVARAAQPPLADATADVKDLVIEALSFHLVRGPPAPAAAARHRPRRPLHEPKMLLVVGGQAPKAIRDVECLELGSGPEVGAGGAWGGRAALPSRRCRAGVAALGGGAGAGLGGAGAAPALVLAVGGFNGALRVRTVDVYDVARDHWVPGPSMNHRRSTLGVCVSGGWVYAVGGFDGAAGLASCEALPLSPRLAALGGPAAAPLGPLTSTHPPLETDSLDSIDINDILSSSWVPLPEMSTRRSSVGVAALRGDVYAVGGYDGASRQCLATVEVLSAGATSWRPVASLQCRRSGAGVAVLDGRLYAVGGHDGPAVRRSVEVLGADGVWSAAPAMLRARRNAGVVAHAGRLIVLGGDDGHANLDTVEVFDPATGVWSELSARMRTARSYAGVAVVPRAAAA